MTEGMAEWVRLSLIPGLGDESFRRLLQEFGSAEAISSAPYAQLSKVVKAGVARAIADQAETEALANTLAWLELPQNRLLCLTDQSYPERLRELPDPPPLLYVKGRLELLSAASLAIVGSRNPTPQGARDAEAFAKTLSDSGLCIVSGLAQGVDAAAHRGGLDGTGRSIAVMGTGLDIVYPGRNRELAHDLARKGALVSELALGTPALAGNFPRRNRIISGLARGCLVVEAALSSGSLITARLAAEQGREVFAIPGSIHSPQSKGCHKLIQQGAKLVECAQDILEELRWEHRADSNPVTRALPEAAEAQRLLAHLGYESLPLDALVVRSGLTAERVSDILLRLELDGAVACLPGGRYQRIVS